MYSVLDVAKLIINFGNTRGYSITYNKLTYLLFLVYMMFDNVLANESETSLFLNRIKFVNGRPEIKIVKRTWGEIDYEIPIDIRFDETVFDDVHADAIIQSVKYFANHSETELEEVAQNMAVTLGYWNAGK